jgi:urea transport system substrate-binding protein
MSNCPPREQLELLTSKKLGAGKQAAVETHVSACVACQQTLASLRPEVTQEWTPNQPDEVEPLPDRKLPAELRDHPRYRVTGVIGGGGMGTVFKAEHRLLDRPVVLKVIRPELLDNLGIVQRFEREAKLAARLSHPNIVSVYEAERLGKTQLLVMEFVEGVNLAELVSQRGLLPVAESCELVRQAAIGLQHIHDQHLVHRDIKPPNLLVSPAGVVKILDLGLATLKSGKGGGELTADRQFLGTVDYAAPEQWESSRDVDIRADIYSLGCTLYYLLAGQSPFPSSKYSTTLQQMWAHSQAPRPPIRDLRADVPEVVAAVVDRMLAKNPDERFGTPGEVAEALRPFVEGCDLAEFVRTARRTTTSRLDLSRVSSASPSQTKVLTGLAARLSRRALVAGAGTVAAMLLIAAGLIMSRGGRDGQTDGTHSQSAANAKESDAHSSQSHDRLATESPRPSGPPIKVGVLHSTTGTMAISERAVIDATLLAIDEINRNGGVLGRPVEPVVEDGESDWPTFADKADKLITQDRVSTIFGCWTSASRKMVLPIVEKHDHLLFYPVQYEGLEQSPNIIYTGAAPNQQIIPAVKWAVSKLNKRRFFLVGSDYVFPRCANAIIRDTTASLNAEVVGEEYLLLGSSDVAEIVRRIVAARPDMILNTVNGDSNVALFRALRTVGIKPDTVPTISFSISEQELSSLSTKDIVGDYAAWNYFHSVDRPQNRAFIERFQSRYGDQRTTSDPMEAAYFGVHLWARAAAEAGSDDVRAIRTAAKHQEFDAPEGMVRIDPDTQHASKIFRIGRITPEGRFHVEYSSEVPIAPIPYPNTRNKGEWDAFLMDLHLRWNGNWANPAM